MPCERPPDGWRCTREPDHDGPCAAVSTQPTPLQGEDREIESDEFVEAYAKAKWAGELPGWEWQETSWEVGEALKLARRDIGYFKTALASTQPDYGTGEKPFKFEIFKDWQGEFRWRLRSRLGQVVATSAASYQSQGIARRAAQEVRVGTGEKPEDECTCTQYLLPDDCPIHGRGEKPVESGEGEWVEKWPDALYLAMTGPELDEVSPRWLTQADLDRYAAVAFKRYVPATQPVETQRAEEAEAVERLARLISPMAFEKSALGLGHQEFAEEDREAREGARLLARDFLATLTQPVPTHELVEKLLGEEAVEAAARRQWECDEASAREPAAWEIAREKVREEYRDDLRLVLRAALTEATSSSVPDPESEEAE